MVVLSNALKEQLFFTLTGSITSKAMVCIIHGTVVMDHLILLQCFMVLLRRILHVLSNQFNIFSLPFWLTWDILFMVVMLLNAYAHSPPPATPTYITIDDAYAEWYEDHFNKKVDQSHVLPVLHALQGHPKSGRLWEEHINSILTSPELGFQHMTHDQTIYSAVIDDVTVLLLCQVDDFALACPNEEIAKRIYGLIGSKLQLPSES